MIHPRYDNQVRLLVNCLPAIFQEPCFAIKGGTAINLFHFNLPRLSVDIDLVYLPVEDKATTYAKIHAALDRITERLNKLHLTVFSSKNETRKLICADSTAQIKIEPNYTLRGTLFPVIETPLCDQAQERYGYARGRLISDAELWGGKICAALDRQHPRDLFDIAQFFSRCDFTPEIKLGFLALLLSSNRPVHELLSPNFTMSEGVFSNEFSGMTALPFTFLEAEQTFHRLVNTIHTRLNDEEKSELLRFVSLEPVHSTVLTSQMMNLPGIRWKVKNLEKLREVNPKKFREQYTRLRSLFNA